MPHEPKKRHSKARQGKRRAAIHLELPRPILCPNCSAPTLSHAVCKQCGFYKGKAVIKLKTKEPKAE